MPIFFLIAVLSTIMWAVDGIGRFLGLKPAHQPHVFSPSIEAARNIRRLKRAGRVRTYNTARRIK